MIKRYCDLCGEPANKLPLFFKYKDHLAITIYVTSNLEAISGEPDICKSCIIKAVKSLEVSE